LNLFGNLIFNNTKTKMASFSSDSRDSKVLFAIQIGADELRDKLAAHYLSSQENKHYRNEGELKQAKSMYSELVADGSSGCVSNVGYIDAEKKYPVSIWFTFWRRKYLEQLGQPLLVTWCFSGRYSDLEIGEAYIKKTFYNVRSLSEKSAAITEVKKVFLEPHVVSSKKQEAKEDFELWYDYNFGNTDDKELKMEDVDVWIPNKILYFCYEMNKNNKVNQDFEDTVFKKKLKHIMNLIKLTNQAIEQCSGSGKPKSSSNDTISIKEFPIGDSSFTYRNSDWLGRDMISINRERDNLYITIGISDRSKETGIAGKFYLIGTNGSLKDVRSAVAATGHLWV
jgi:hypothetical protein